MCQTAVACPKRLRKPIPFHLLLQWWVEVGLKLHKATMANAYCLKRARGSRRVPNCRGLSEMPVYADTAHTMFGDLLKLDESVTNTSMTKVTTFLVPRAPCGPVG